VTIGELSERTDIPSSTLRYWERIGVLPKAVRVSGQRRYAAESVDLIGVLKLAQACGFSLPEMRRLLYGFRSGATPSERWRSAVRDHREILERKIAELNAMRGLLDRVEHCQCIDLVECGRSANKLLGRAPVKRTSW
jgi:MerR family redox-sensitive transcriptional activator SoxR